MVLGNPPVDCGCPVRNECDRRFMQAHSFVIDSLYSAWRYFGISTCEFDMR